jgi:hypothetical protein
VGAHGREFQISSQRKFVFAFHIRIGARIPIYTHKNIITTVPQCQILGKMGGRLAVAIILTLC